MADQPWALFERQLRAYVRRRVDPLWADDLVGDILLRLLRRPDALAAADKPFAWVRRVAANAIADHYRRHAVERRALAELEKTDAGSADRSPEQTQGDDTVDELAPCLRPFIRALPPAYAEALQLTDLDGMTQAAAARRLGLSLSGMKSRVQRGRARLKQALQRCCAIEFDRRGQIMEARRRTPASGRDCSC